jgi:hypothetical protein
MVEVLPTRVTPELEYLQVKWAAHLPYAQAVALLGEVLPIADVISVSGLKRRVRAVGAALESVQVPSASGVAGRQIATRVDAAPTSVAVDSAWLKHCDPPPRQARHVNLVAGRVCFQDGRSRVYAYVHNQVPSAAARLDRFLSSSGIGPLERVTILCDAASEFEKAVQRTGRHEVSGHRADGTEVPWSAGAEWRDHHSGNQVSQVVGLAWQGAKGGGAPQAPS